MYEIKLPVYINTIFDEVCEDCRYCDLVFDKEIIDKGTDNESVAYTMTCSNMDLCLSVIAKVLEEKYGEEE